MRLLLLAALLWLGDPAAAERAYREGRYAEALARYEQLLAEPGAPAGELHYNLGNCAYRLGRHAEAVLHYRRALLRLPRDPRLQGNLRLAERQLGLVAAEPSPLERVLLLAKWTPLELLAASVALQAVGLLGLLICWRRPGARAWLAAALLLGAAAGAHLVRQQWFAGPPPAVVLPSDLPLRPEPHAELPPAGRLHAGELVTVLELSDRWARIEHPRGSGWVERSALGLVQ